jgi:hypothetical protein
MPLVVVWCLLQLPGSAKPGNTGRRQRSHACTAEEVTGLRALELAKVLQLIDCDKGCCLCLAGKMLA